MDFHGTMPQVLRPLIDAGAKIPHVSLQARKERKQSSCITGHYVARQIRICRDNQRVVLFALPFVVGNATKTTLLALRLPFMKQKFECMSLCVLSCGVHLSLLCLGTNRKNPKPHHTNDVDGKIFTISHATILALRNSFC